MDRSTKYIVCAVLLALAVCLTALSPALEARADNSAPVAENLELLTYRNVSVGGRLKAVDPDGDTLSFEITTEPVKGSIELTEDGRFVYTPDYNKRGRDYFGYKAVDSEGNLSQEATVIIKITKQKTDVKYEDMQGNAAAYAAARLAEEGIFVGQSLAGVMTFSPEAAVSRGEFLALCMEASEADTLSGVVSTGFYDDELIPDWQKVYVATALMDGVICGYSTQGGAVFDAEAAISYSEAAVMLDNILGLSEVSSARAGLSAPVWAAQSAANLAACGVLQSVSAYDAPLCRAEAAEMIVSAMDLLRNR